MENVMLAFLGLGFPEILLILAVILIMFGAKKLPELAKGLGKGIREFKKASTDVRDEFQQNWDETEHEEHRARERERPRKADPEDKKDSVTVESTSESEKPSKA